ncbi:Thiopurine S-methyltransferase [Hyphomicrobium sp. 1Nfss2.1]|uniref:thiopurine S-methyltransferase n=1 Tax=Hyphomicrobium sp. 1Nfss2.1 TaxID=3413936 RepID=UPI003C7DD06A
MDPKFWRERWNNQEIGFHQSDYEPALNKYWSRLALAPRAKVFVPLCGKSLDMVWLAEHGFQVIGAELSERAVDDFFAERGVEPEVRREGAFVVKSSGAYEIWCGDFFELPRSAVEDVAGIYDRAALIALPAEMQRRYVGKMLELFQGKAPMLLITLDYDQSLMSGPPFATPRQTVVDLYSDHYDLVELVSKDVLESNPRFKERGLNALTGAAFLLQPK